jgi:hypothetical protein
MQCNSTWWFEIAGQQVAVGDELVAYCGQEEGSIAVHFGCKFLVALTASSSPSRRRGADVLRVRIPMECYQIRHELQQNVGV